MKDRLMAHKALWVFMIVLLCVGVSYAGTLLHSRRGDNESLREYLNKTTEHDLDEERISTLPHGKGVKRKASEDKSPINADNLWEMELPVWPHYDISGWNWQSSWDDTQWNPTTLAKKKKRGIGILPFGDETFDSQEPGSGWYLIGCWLNCPNEINCTGGPFT